MAYGPPPGSGDDNDNPSYSDHFNDNAGHYYRVADEETRQVIYDRMAGNYKDGSEALAILKEVLFGDKMKDKSVMDLMIQFGLQFTGDMGAPYFENHEDEFAEVDKLDEFETLENKEQLIYNRDNFSSFDDYNDCSGFVQDLYYTFFGKTLGYVKKTGKEVQSGHAANQFEKQSIDGKLIKTTDISDVVLKEGDLIYYDYTDSNGNTVDHVVMFIGNNKVIESSYTKKGVVVSDVNLIENVKGYATGLTD